MLAGGQPVVFGFTCYSSFESDAVAVSGVLPMPQPGEAIAGGHAVLAVGYDDDRAAYIVRNSYGPSWGIRGYFEMPYAYWAGNVAGETGSDGLPQPLVDDRWVITAVS